MMISSLTKNVTIERPVTDVRDALRHLHLYTNKYRLRSENEVLNQCTYEASEFLNLGSFIEFTYQSAGPRKTRLQIDVRRKVGTFNQSHEITAANDHFMRISDLLATSLSNDPADRVKEAGGLRMSVVEQRQRTRDEFAENWKKRPVQSFFVSLFFLLGFIGIVSLLMHGCS